MKRIFLVCIVSCFTVEFVQGAGTPGEEKDFQDLLNELGSAQIPEAPPIERFANHGQKIEALTVSPNQQIMAPGPALSSPVTPPAEGPTSPVGPVSNQSASTPSVSAVAPKTSAWELPIAAAAQTFAVAAAGVAATAGAAIQKQKWEKTKEALVQANPELGEIDYGISSGPEGIFSKTNFSPKENIKAAKEGMKAVKEGMRVVKDNMNKEGMKEIKEDMRVVWDNMNAAKEWTKKKLRLNKYEETKTELKPNKNVTSVSTTNLEEPTASKDIPEPTSIVAQEPVAQAQESTASNEPAKNPEITPKEIKEEVATSKTEQNNLQPTQKSWFTLPNVGLVAGAAALAAGGYWLYKKYYEYQANSMNVAFRKQFYNGKNNEMIDKAFYLWPELYAFPPSDCKKIMPVMLAVAHKMGMVIDKLGMNNSVTVEFGTLVRDLLINYRTVGLAKTVATLDKLVKLQN